MSDFDTCQFILIRMAYKVLISPRSNVTFNISVHEVCVRVGVRYVITQFSRMDSLPNFPTHGAPLARFALTPPKNASDQSTNAAHKSLRQVRFSPGWEPGDERNLTEPEGHFVLELSRFGYTQICVARGTVSWGSEDDAAGELQLWYHERGNEYCIYAGNTAGDDMEVCKVIDGFTLHFQKCTDKIILKPY